MSTDLLYLTHRTLSGATAPDQSGSESDGNKEVLSIPQSSSITRISSSDVLVSYPGKYVSDIMEHSIIHVCRLYQRTFWSVSMVTFFLLCQCARQYLTDHLFHLFHSSSFLFVLVKNYRCLWTSYRFLHLSVQSGVSTSLLNTLSVKSCWGWLQFSLSSSIWIVKYVSDCSWGWPEGSLFNSYYTEV